MKKGIVWKARDLITNEIVALKQIKFDTEMLKQGFPTTALREISVLLALSHECIVTVREMVVGTDYDKVFMVMEVSKFVCDIGRYYVTYYESITFYFLTHSSIQLLPTPHTLPTLHTLHTLN